MVNKLTMNKNVVIIIAEDDEGHASLIIRNLKRFGITNKIIWFKDGQEVLDFLFRNGSKPQRKNNTPYLLLLDLKLPIVSGIEVMESLKKDDEMRKIPVVIISTTDDKAEIEKCHNLGCVRFVGKPVDHKKFAETMGKLAQYLINLEAPRIQ